MVNACIERLKTKETTPMAQQPKTVFEPSLLTGHEMEQLRQLVGLVWDGDLVSKTCRDRLVKLGLATYSCGWNVLTPKGIRLLVCAGELRP
jgi:hypothetical protein